MRAGSVSPVRRRDAHHRFSPSFEPSDGASRNRGVGNGREPGRYRDYSPPYGRGKDGGRFPGRDHDQSAGGPGPFRVEGLPRNNPNVRPREGDWICSDPSCKNLNFARREHCNNCNKPRYGSSGSPRRGYPGPTFPPRQRVPPTPLDHSPGRIMNGGYRSPPRGWPRNFKAGGPQTRHEGRFPDRQDYPEVDPPRDRYRYDRPVVPDWSHRDRGRDNYFNERRGWYGRRVLSPPSPAPPVPPPRGWASHNNRDRSRSPVRGGGAYMNRRRDDRRAVGRDAF
ncbi:hypothetical protein DH2020_014446 [Rehmannia glutinosa]|uniref:RanBP2-type domain-containing protein n=1 Tax=Rehmannia glutinosa TaxID=99300 RepID=A0ABR0WXT9_REHGL